MDQEKAPEKTKAVAVRLRRKRDKGVIAVNPFIVVMEINKHAKKIQICET